MFGDAMETAWSVKMSSGVTSSQQQTFVNQMLPYAQYAANQLGGGTNPGAVQAILAQWADETGWGTSSAALDQNNFAGITNPNSQSYYSYSSIEDFVNAYVSTWKNGSSGYSNVLSAMQSGSATQIANAMAASAWAGGHYGGNALTGLNNDLTGVEAEVAKFMGNASSSAVAAIQSIGSSASTSQYQQAATSQIPFYACSQSGANVSITSPSTWGALISSCGRDVLSYMLANGIFVLLVLGGIYLLFREPINSYASDAIKQAKTGAEAAAMAG
jgi:hypothetical protein